MFFATACTLPGLGCALQPQGGPGSAASQSGFEALNCRAIGGDKAAQISLARAYETGTGLPRDMKLAVDWYERAARPSSRPSSRVASDYVAPVDDQRFGRTQTFPTVTDTPGDAFAQFRLGEIYLAGDGVKQSDRRARGWLKRSAHQGYGPAIDLLAQIEAKE